MAGEHEIQGLMKTAMDSLCCMIDVNTVVGDMVTAGEVSIIPVSKVSCGFVAGGGEYGKNPGALPFAGGSGAGVSVQPVGFLVINRENVRLVSVDGNNPLEKLFDSFPNLLEQIQKVFHKNKPDLK